MYQLVLVPLDVQKLNQLLAANIMEDQWLDVATCVHQIEIINYEHAVMNTAGVFCMTRYS